MWTRLTHWDAVWIIFIAAMILSACRSVLAEDGGSDRPRSKSGYDDIPEFGGPGSVGTELEDGDALNDPKFRFPAMQQALRPWFDGKRKLHSDYGLSFAADYQALYQSVDDSAGANNALGGIFRLYGSWNLVGEEGGDSGNLVFKAENRHRSGSDVAPQDLGFEAGAVSVTGAQFSNIGWAMTNMYWQQSFKELGATFVAGQVDVTDYVDVYGLVNPLSAFSNLNFLTNPTIPAPSPGIGVGAGIYLSDHVYAIAGLTDANADPTEPDLDVFDDFETFKHLELGWVTSQERRYFDNFHLTLWQVDKRDDAGVGEDWGLSGSASWFFGNAWMPFFRAGWSDDKAALLEKSVSTGVGYVNRARDLMAIGINWGQAADRRLQEQYVGEVFYRLQVTELVAITPSLQVVIDPAQRPDQDALFIFGLRGRLAL